MTIHQTFNLCVGVAKAPGDSQSAEQGVVKLSLLNSNGFSLPDDGWIPQIAQVKNGGLFADTALADGARLIAGNYGNITENITLQATGATLVTRSALISSLHNYARLAKEFWERDSQIEPVFLEWFAPGAPAPQYALIYTIGMAEQTDPFSDASQLESVLQLSIVREPYWRALPPGANPKEWYFYTQGLSPGSGYDYTDLSLGISADVIASATLPNQFSWNTTLSTIVNNPSITIPAASIPGDAPALVHLYVSSSEVCVVAGVTTRPASLTLRSAFNPPMPQRLNMLNAADATQLTDVAEANDTGASIKATTGVRRRTEISFASGTSMTARLTWQELAGSSLRTFHVNLTMGTFAVYVRARQVNGSSGQIKMKLRYSQDASFATYIESTEVVAQLAGTTGATTNWKLHYMGTVTTPLAARVNASLNGYGLGANNSGYLDVQLLAQRTTGAGVLYINDIILIPIDKASFDMRSDYTINLADNTGYWSHGDVDGISGYLGLNNTTTDLTLVDFRGQFLTLQPKIDNTICMLCYDESLNSTVSSTNAVYIQIVPRWCGIRDV